jgi:hypothetical protein
MEIVVGFAIALIAGVWVYNDAQKRGSAFALGWAIGTVGLLIVFLPLWLFIRPPLVTSLCAGCEKYYHGGVSFCPNCGQRLVRL